VTLGEIGVDFPFNIGGLHADYDVGEFFNEDTVFLFLRTYTIQFFGGYLFNPGAWV
jgi:hypothetical protein